jgi:hypothetical protein
MRHALEGYGAIATQTTQALRSSRARRLPATHGLRVSLVGDRQAMVEALDASRASPICDGSEPMDSRIRGYAEQQCGVLSAGAGASFAAKYSTWTRCDGTFAHARSNASSIGIGPQQ